MPSTTIEAEEMSDAPSTALLERLLEYAAELDQRAALSRRHLAHYPPKESWGEYDLSEDLTRWTDWAVEQETWAADLRLAATEIAAGQSPSEAAQDGSSPQTTEPNP